VETVPRLKRIHSRISISGVIYALAPGKDKNDYVYIFSIGYLLAK